HTRWPRDWSSDVCSSDLPGEPAGRYYLPSTPVPRLAIAQIRPTKGEYAANVQRIGGVLAQLAKLEPAVDLVVFPETATSGYFVRSEERRVGKEWRSRGSP